MRQCFKSGLFVRGLALAMTFSVFAACTAEQKIAVVNVSKVFENYQKVPDIQRRIDKIHEARKDELTARGKELGERNRQLEALYQQSGKNASEQVFDAVQALRKQQFLYERDVNVLNEQIQDDYAREMREVLSDIRQAIRQKAEGNSFDMVLRSPDSDNPGAGDAPKTIADPNDKRTYLQKIQPQNTYELLERFNRNPVLYGKETVDITDDILKTLNAAFLRKSALPGLK